MYKLPRMNREELHEVLRTQVLCRIAFHDINYPYIAPFQYLLLDNTLYFQFANYGKKMRLLKQDNRVCVEVESYTSDLSHYSFIILVSSGILSLCLSFWCGCFSNKRIFFFKTSKEPCIVRRTIRMWNLRESVSQTN